MKTQEYLRLLVPMFDEFDKVLREGDYPLEEKYDGEHSYLWLLEELEKTKDPSLLLPLLKLPEKVLPHFQDLLGKRRLIGRKEEGNNALSRYKPAQESDIVMTIMANLVRILKVKDVPEEEALDFIAAEFLPDCRRDFGYDASFNRHMLELELNGKRSARRNMKKRRATKKKPA